MSNCLDCGGAPLLMDGCNTCLGTGLRTATRARKATAPKTRRKAAVDSGVSFDPANFDPTYGNGSSRRRGNTDSLFAALPPKPGPYSAPEEALQSVWGYSHFRPGQREIIEEVIQGRDLLVVAATSFGKSITFQIPALLRQDCPVLVISPLIALQRDQVRALDAVGVPALMLNSMLSQHELDARYTQIPDANLVYVAPERLDNHRFKEALARCPPWLVAIDEMHSIDEAGLSYRPAYRFIQEMTAKSGKKLQWLAVTASATPATVAGIRTRLGLDHARTIRFSVERSNLTYRVEQMRVGEKIGRVGQLTKHVVESGGAVIVYTSFRKDAEEVLAPYLQRIGVRAEFYHAGLTRQRREEVEAAFFGKKIHVVVATCAFGMGIDRSDVRLVVMHGMAKSVEDFYQSMGRAGRDGSPSKCIALYDPYEDYRRKRWLIENGDIRKLAQEYTARGWTDEQMEQAKAMQLAQLDECKRFLTGFRCRVQLLKAYFGEAEGPVCGRCDICSP